MVNTDPTTTTSSSSRRSSDKNIWIASSDGDLSRVIHLLTSSPDPVMGAGLGPNVFDPNSYSPMHAAASYAHFHVLDHLISVGGDINLKDEDGETPLFTVESKEAAEEMIRRGAEVQARNNEGQTAAEYLFEDYPEVAIYLQSLVMPSSATSSTSGLGEVGTVVAGAGEGTTEALSAQLTDDLIAQTQEIMKRAEQTGENPDELLRAVVGKAVLDGWKGAQEGAMDVEEEAEEGRSERKRRRET